MSIKKNEDGSATLVIEWCTGDLQWKACEMGYILSKEQAVKILERLNKNYDCCVGICWDTIGFTITDMKDELDIEFSPEDCEKAIDSGYSPGDDLNDYLCEN